MFSPDQIEALRIQSGQIISPVIEFLISDIASRIAEAGQLTSTAAYQIWRAQNLGISQKELKKELRKRLKVSHRELRKLLTQAAEVGYDFDIKRFPFVQAVPFDENESLQRIVQTAADMADENLTNLTQTMGFVTYDGKVTGLTEAYRKSCDFAFEKIFTGAQDYNSAIRQATKGLAEKGIQTIDYESGVHRSLEAAVRGSFMGGLGIMQEEISQQNHDDLGCDGWEISAHRGSAPDHEPFQGKQYSDAEYTRLNNSLVRRIGTLNCGHSAMGIIMGINDPQYTPEELAEMKRENAEGITYEDGKHYTLYEATQRQRGLERTLRKQKRKILIDEKTGDKEKLVIDQTRYVVADAEYKRFSKAAGLRLQHERANVPGFGAKQHSAAERTAKTADAPSIAREESPRPSKKANYAVDWDVVQTEGYAQRFSKLSDSEKSNNAVCTRARWALNNRDGVKTEEIYAVDMNTGEEIARITDQHFPQGVKRTRQFDSALKKAATDGSAIMLIHNHPGGSPPSISDLNALLSTPNAKGIVAGHDGSIYRYSAPKEKIPQFDFDVAIMKYKGYTYNTAHEKALHDIAEQYGFEFTKL